jgi:amino acid adenylation domain-containing protein
MNDPEAAGKNVPMSGVDYDPFAGATTVELASTPAQREIWLSSKLGSGAGCEFIESFSVYLTGLVDEKAMIQGLQTLTEFHEALRGRFSPDGERFIIEPVVTVPVVRHDLSARSASDRASALEQLLSADAGASFNLETGPLFRAAIICLGAREWVVTFSAYHAVCDGWSLDVLLSDLAKLYSAFVGSAPLPVPPRHAFSDYLVFCGTPEHAARIEASRAFWRKAFQVPPPALDLPADGERPAVRSYGARHVLRDIPMDLLVAAKQFSREQGLSFFSVLLSTLAVLLHRLSGAVDIVVGIPVAGHPDAGMEDCVGHLVNLVPVRCQVKTGLSFLELCRASHVAVLDARENASVGFSEIVVDLQVRRDSARVPLIAVIVTHAQKYAPEKLSFPGCSLEYHLNGRRFETFELNLNLIESHEGLQIKAHANADLYSQAWVEWRLHEFESLLRHGCSSPGVALDDLSLLPAEEVSLVTDVFNRTGRDYPPPFTLHELFARCASESGDRTAVVDAATGVSLTYREFDHVTGRLAAILRERGFSNEIVGVCMERSLSMVCALHAIVRAGGAYLPLDPDYPQERLRLMADDAQCRAVLTQTALVSIGRELHGTVIDVQALWPELLREGPTYSAPGNPDSIAYVIYTSGSTGVPKGVPNTHRGVVNRLRWMQELLDLTPKDRVAQKTPFNFDVSVWEFFWPLLWGGTLVTIAPGIHRDPVELARTLKAFGVTIAHFVPSMLRLFIDEPSAAACTTLRAVICSGEALPADLRDDYYRVLSGTLYNFYGPTEAAIDVTYFTVDRTDRRRFVPIGRPAANTRMYVLDGRDRPVPVAVEGLLHIGGIQVAPGYLNRAELTSERFIVDPFVQGANRRLYRTGDRARWHADGNLEYLGRDDFQVKIRGNRIELGDVESALRRHPMVADAVVSTRPSAVGDELVAYVVGRDSAGVDLTKLRDHCRLVLPPVMVPARFAVLKALPRLPNGKLDRTKLPDASPHQSATIPPAAALSSAERTIQGIWAKHLGTSDFKIGDNFFDIGGNSFLTVRIVSDLEQAFGRTIGFTNMFQYPTVESLAHYLAAAPGDEAGSAVNAAVDRARMQREALQGHRRRPAGQGTVAEERNE